MKMNPNMDDLLNSYVDEELSTRQKTEIRRLAERNEQVRARLQDLQNLKTLIRTLPRPEAPAEISDQIRSLLERRSLFGEIPSDSNRPIYHLIFQKIRAGAAVAGLVAVFCILVYSIIAPPRHTPAKGPDAGGPAVVQSVRPQAAETVGLSGRLELYCSTLAPVDSAIQRAIERNEIIDYERQGSRYRRIYQVQCSEAALNRIVLNLQDMWPRFTNAHLYLHTDGFGRCVEVESISHKQLTSITSQGNASASLDIARRVAVRNSMDQMTLTGQVLASLVDVPEAVLVVPKPMLTASQPQPIPEEEPSGSPERASLTIVLIGRE